MNDELNNLLQKLYLFLRGQGFAYQSNIIRRLIYYAETGDYKNLKKGLKSSIIWGGAGSIRDIDLMDREKQLELETYLKDLKKWL
jgi:hypothetical protein